LLVGILLAQLVGHPYIEHNKIATSLLLKISVIGLGFGMNIHTALKAGTEGILFTIVSIFGTLVLGALLGRMMGIDKKTSYLISSGTAICGGSAIAAISPILHADEKQISVALGIVFIFNSIALILFPVIGHALNLSQVQFGLWSAIAIHDTSSVVGAASRFGPEALEVATTVKLTRALWIIPLAIVTTFLFKSKTAKISIPYFIGLFIIAMLMNTWLPWIHSIAPALVLIAKAGLTLTLFLIGAGLSGKVLASVGVKPFIQGVILWIVISFAALWAVMTYG
jgi:uncharacterized integral membrane protein (TIGR00698 family)